jgi:acetate---CoA ligase (ADP-forming)
MRDVAIQHMTRSPLARLIAPRSIVFIGGLEAEVAIRVTRQLGFPGTIHAVNPHREQLAGITCLKSVAELPETPDAAFIALKRELTVEMVAALSRRGVGGAVVYASGFAEVGGRGQALQDELIAAAGNMAIMGPNCYGYINALDQASPWPDEHGLGPCERGVAIVTQSGNMAVNFAMMRRALPVAGIYSLGNQAGVDAASLLDALLDEPRISAIGLHIEGLKDVQGFAAAAAKSMQARKPVVVLKTGRSEQGAKVTMSHTSSLAGTDDLYDALFARYGLARVSSVSAFAETLKLLHHGGPLAGNRLVSMSCSGGEAALVSDMAMDRIVQFPPLDAETRDIVAATLNDYVVIDNPLDYHTFIWDQPDKLFATFSAVLSGGFDAAMLILDIPTRPPMDPRTWVVAAEAFARAAAATGARAVTVSTLHESMPEDVAERLSAAGVAPLLGLDDALTALEAAGTIGAAWTRGVPRLPLQRSTAGTPPRLLSEHAAKQRLAAYGLAIPHGVVCTPGEAPAAARRLGFPVVLKASGGIAHKSDSGGVALGLNSEADVAAAARHMATLADEVLVEQMVGDAVCELIVGIKTDAQFGLALVIGAGGVLAELLGDSITLLLPTERVEIAAALSRLRVSTLIVGFRGRAGDRDAAISAIEAVARFSLDHAESLDELDVNPLLVLTPGKGAVAADALIRLRE